MLFALVLGLLVPLPGTIVLVGGEALLILRLLVRNRDNPAAYRVPSRGAKARWGAGFRRAASKWGFAASMIAFTWTLQDRVAEVGGAISILVWLTLNFPRLIRPQHP